MDMRRLLVPVVALAVGVAVAGCETSSGSGSGDPLTSKKDPVPGFFHEIPGQSFYVATGLEPIPEKIVREQLKGKRSTYLSRILESGIEENPRGTTEKLRNAILEELRGNMTPEGIRELGLPLEPHPALYGLGGVPVFRMNLSDPDAFKAMLNRVETEAEVDVRMKRDGNIQYRMYRDGTLHMPLVVRDGAVVAAAYDEELDDILLPYVLGKREPKKSLADTGQIRDLVDTYRYDPYAVGFFDARRFIRTLEGVRKPKARTKAVFKAAGETLKTASKTCKREIRQFTDRAPRVVGGTTELSARKLEYEMGLELDDELGPEVAGLTHSIPGAETSQFRNAMIGLGFGIDVERTQKMLGKHARSISKSPYQCEELEQLNTWAKRYQKQPIPSFVSNLKGASIILTSASWRRGQTAPEELDAMALVESSDPNVLVGQLKQVVPGLRNVSVKDDGVPRPLRQLQKRVPFLEAPHVAMLDAVLGFSVGVGMQDELAGILEDPASAATETALAIRYDLDKIRRALPSWVKSETKSSMGEEFLERTVTGSGQIRLIFRESGVFVATRGEQGTGTGDGASGRSRDHGDGARSASD